MFISMKNLFFIFCLLFSGYLFAQIPDGYYDAASGKKGYQLRVALHGIIDNHTVVSYSSLWTHFYTTDDKPDGTVWDMYSDIPAGTPSYTFAFGTDQCGSYSAEGDCYNREHSLPKSWFGDISPLNSDLFHIYPTDGYVNNRRGNYPFGEVDSPTWTSSNGSKLGNCSFSGYSGVVFEPIDSFKGDFARSYFYMATRYMEQDFGQESLSMFSGSEFKSWALTMLISWNNLDPVSQKEIDRNNAVYQIQNNRNPFIDFPELVGKIFGSDSVNPFNPNSISEYDLNHPFLVFPNPAKEKFYISNNFLSIDEVLIFDILGKPVLQIDGITSPVVEISTVNFTSGFYIIKISEGNLIRTKKLVINKDGNY
jgi:endonuclease I